MKYLIGVLLIIPLKCNLCGNNHIILKETKLYLSVMQLDASKKCSKAFYLRENSFLALFLNTNSTSIICIIKIWLIEKKKGNEIYKKLQNDYASIKISKKYGIYYTINAYIQPINSMMYIFKKIYLNIINLATSGWKKIF